MAGFEPKKILDSLGIGKKGRKRSSKVAEAIRNELSILLVGKVQDPRLLNLSISRVEVTDDLSQARIFFTVLGDEKAAKAAAEGLQRARGFMRTHIARTLNLRFTPDLQFRYDDVVGKVAELEEIFQEIANERKTRDENP